jgi:hypothetical protein
MKARRTIAIAVAAAATVAGVAGGGGAAKAQDYSVDTGPVTIKIKLKGKHPFFKGPKRITQGEKLTVLNQTAVQKIGPHTFSLVKPVLIPRTKKARKRCTLCETIGIAHKFNPKTEKVNKPKVEAGEKGWDKSFGKKGDSWYTDAKGQKHARRVSAPVGTVLTYFCAVHPTMKGKIRVVD